MRVLEISDALGAAAYCGKLFRRWGHEVVRVESPGALPADPAAELYLNGGKLRATCDLDSSADRGELDRIAATADLLITDRAVTDIEHYGLLDIGAGKGPIARVALTPFGLTGPYAHAPATEATLLALGGYTNLIGDPHREPLTFVGRYASYQQGTMGFIAGVATTLAASADPVTIDLSALETLASLHQSTYSKWLETGQARGRSGNRMDGAANSLLRVKDGWAGVSFQQQFWFSFATMIGRLDIAEGHPLSTPAGRLKHYEELVEVVEGAFRDRTMQDLFDEAQGQWRIPIGKLLGIREALEDRHLLEREFWRPLEEPIVGHEELRVPGSSFRVIGEPLPAEHAPIEAVPIASLTSIPRTHTPSRGSRTGDVTKPLDGLRVLDLSRVWAGPTAARILGDLGADVIKVEAPTNRGPREVAEGTRGYLMTDRNRATPWNAQTVFNQLQRNRRGVCLDLKSEDGKALFLDLVRESHVVIENFSARAMGRLGLGYDVMCAANPRIIYVPMPAFGRGGPYRDYVGLGTSVEPLASIPSILGYEGGDARTAAIAIPDPMAGTTAAAAVLLGLLRRDATGEGCEFDFSQQETSIGFIGEYFIQAQLDGVEPSRAGNSHPGYAPYGLYPCAGDDEWIALAARDDAEWTALAGIAARGWAEDPRFITNEDRLANRDALDELIAEWTAPQSKRALTEGLMAAGVPVGGVLKGPELVADAQLAARSYFADLEHPVIGPQRFDGAPFVFNGQRGYGWWRPTPMLGEHNREVLAEILGLEGSRIDALEAAGVLRDAPPE